MGPRFPHHLSDSQIEELIDSVETAHVSPRFIQKLGEEVGDETARWAIEQVALRKKADSKFKNATQMLFVREAMEQATHHAVASWHASLFPEGSHVFDLTCGIGGDLIALARAHTAIGYELDEDRAACARWNVGVAKVKAEVREASCFEAPRGVEYVLADPSRRQAGKRFIGLAGLEPPPLDILREFGNAKLGLLKLSPMISDPEISQLQRERDGNMVFVSYGRECRESLFVWGDEGAGLAGAYHVESGQMLPATPPPNRTDEVRAFFLDADPALVRAHASGALGLPSLGDSLGYFTSENDVVTAWARTYPVLAAPKFDAKALRGALRVLEATVVEVKLRGVSEDVAMQAKSLGAFGRRRVSVALWRSGKSVKVAILGLPA